MTTRSKTGGWRAKSSSLPRIFPVFALLFSLMLYCLPHVSKNESRLSHYRCHQEPDFPRAAE